MWAGRFLLGFLLGVAVYALLVIISASKMSGGSAQGATGTEAFVSMAAELSAYAVGIGMGLIALSILSVWAESALRS